MKQVRKLVNIPAPDHFLQRHLRQAVYIQGVPADKQSKRLQPLRIAFGIYAIQRFHIIYLADLGRPSAYGTYLRYILYPASGQIFRDLGNNHICLIHFNGIPHSQLQRFHNTNIMHAGPADRRALQLHRLKDRHRVDQSGPGRTPFYLHQLGLPDFIRPFKRHGVSWKFGCVPQGQPVINIIQKQHQPVRRKIIVADPLGKRSHDLLQIPAIHHHVFHYIKSLVHQPLKLLST